MSEAKYTQINPSFKHINFVPQGRGNAHLQPPLPPRSDIRLLLPPNLNAQQRKLVLEYASQIVSACKDYSFDIVDSYGNRANGIRGQADEAGNVEGYRKPTLFKLPNGITTSEFIKLVNR